MRTLRPKEVHDHTTSKWWNQDDFRAQGLPHHWGSEESAEITSDGAGIWAQAFLIPRPTCFITTRLCCLPLSAGQNQLLTALRIHHCPNHDTGKCLLTYLLCHQTTSFSLLEALQAASPRPLVRTGCSLSSRDPHHDLLYPSHEIYQFAPGITHMLLRGRWWSVLASCLALIELINVSFMGLNSFYIYFMYLISPAGRQQDP